MIVRVSNGKYLLYSADGTRRLSKPGTLDEIRRRERQVQFFKHLNKVRRGRG